MKDKSFYTAPAYQEYASNLIGNDSYFDLSPEECGLFHRIRLFCWCNGTVSANPQVMARRIGFSADDVERIFPKIAKLFDVQDGLVSSREIEDYRARVSRNAEKRSAAGKASASAKAANKRSTYVEHVCNTVNQTKPNQTHAVREAEDCVPTLGDTWVASYVGAEHG